MGQPRQALVDEGRVRGRELRIAVGRQIDRGERLVVQRVREWQRDRDYRIINVKFCCAWHDTPTNLRDHILVAGRTRRCRTSCCRWSRCWCRGRRLVSERAGEFEHRAADAVKTASGNMHGVEARHYRRGVVVEPDRRIVVQ